MIDWIFGGQKKLKTINFIENEHNMKENIGHKKIFEIIKISSLKLSKIVGNFCFRF